MTSPTSLDHYRLLGRSGLRVSPLSLGTMTFGADWGWGADAYEHLSPFIGDAAPRPLFRAQFVVEDLWATMPPWEVAVPFLLICGFATVTSSTPE